MAGQCLLLAAGRGTRFGSDKRRAPLSGGLSVLAATALRYSAPTLPTPLAIVIGPQDASVAEHTDQSLRAAGCDRLPRWLVAQDAELGMGHSLAAAVHQLLPADPDWLLVGLGDMPFVATHTLFVLSEALATAAPDAMVRPRYHGQSGQPVGFGAAVLPRLLELHGDAGARSLLASAPEQVSWVDVDDAGVTRDIDRPSDLPSA
ncbi:MAG: nucleotidyltransferase family protein [Pseudomonadota bacterium]